MTTVKVPPMWDTMAVVPLPEVARAAHIDRHDLYNLVSRGQINPTGERGRHGAYQVTKEDAINLLMAIALAFAAGIAIATAVRAISAGATFPVPRG